MLCLRNLGMWWSQPELTALPRTVEQRDITTPLLLKLEPSLYCAWLPAKFWLAGFLNAVYLHNQLVHFAMNKTPYESWYGCKPDNTHLKTFGSCVCVKRTGSCRCKLNHNNFTGIYLGYTVTDQNITYLHLNSGIVKSCHCAIFDEAWYLQPTQPPAAQLLYDLGLEAEIDYISITGPIYLTPPGTITSILVPWPPLPPGPFLNATSSKTPPLSLYAPLPLQVTDAPHTVGAKAAWVRSQGDQQSKK